MLLLKSVKLNAKPRNFVGSSFPSSFFRSQVSSLMYKGFDISEPVYEKHINYFKMMRTSMQTDPVSDNHLL